MRVQHFEIRTDSREACWESKHYEERVRFRFCFLVWAERDLAVNCTKYSVVIICLNVLSS